MNKMLFHEGGMPVNLDDFSLLQEQTFVFMKSLFNALSGSHSAFLLDLPKIRQVKKGGNTDATVIEAGQMVVDGEILKWPITQLDGIASQGLQIFACVHESENDPRIFADGQTRKCRKERSVYISASSVGAAAAYEFEKLPLLSDLLSELVNKGEWTYAKIYGYNGYAGYFRYRNINQHYRIQISLNSAQNDWSMDSSLFYGDAKAVCGVNFPNPIFLQKSWEVKNGQQKIGDLQMTTSGVLILQLAQAQLKPANCPINLDIEL